MSFITTLSHKIKNESKRLGFSACGIAQAQELTAEAHYLESWLNQNRHANMSYMANHFEKRIDPTKLVEGARSVISLSYNYYTPQKQKDPTAPKIAMYALGKDYHSIVKKQADALLQYICTQAGKVQGKCFVDTAPILERTWAQRAGVGWVGKNTNLLTKRQGSYFFLAEIILDLTLDYDSPVRNYCGSCTLCIDACPTQAIYEPYKLDASKCISYFTIELKEQVIPPAYHGKFDNWMYGCDICQQVCPINSQATPHTSQALNPSLPLLDMTKEEWNDLSQQKYQEIFKGSAVKRAKYIGLKRNIQFLKM